MSQQKAHIRPLLYEDLGDFWEIVVMAGSEGYYPNDKSRRVNWFNRLMTELPTFSYYGAFREDRLVGGMAISEFALNVRSTMVRLASVGMVHTDMLHKKEKVCRDMMAYFIASSRGKGIPILHLSPFRPDFYRQMGFGYGASLYHFRIPPKGFPNAGSKENLCYIDEAQKDDYLRSLGRACRHAHGAIQPFWTLGAFAPGK